MNFSLAPYHYFSSLPFPKSYVGKFLLVAFLGVHIPLIALVGYVAAKQSATWSAALPMLLVALAATLVGTAATLIVQTWLLAPLIQTARVLDEYRRSRKVPQLPTGYTDDAGILMASAQHCVEHLEALLVMKNDLLAVISHDTRNPLAQIVTASQLIELNLESPAPKMAIIKRMSDLIRNSGETQIKLMDNLMQLARSEREAITFYQNNVAVSDLLETIVDNSRLQAECKTITINIEDKTADPAGKSASKQLILDLAKTTQVLNNLVHNAIKFTPEGGTVTLGAAHETSGKLGGQLAFTVRDTGIGMDEKIIQAIFKPFSKAGRRGTRGETTSGLGLWICKMFTEAQGGQIDVRSETGKGSCFTVSLPWRPAVVTNMQIQPDSEESFAGVVPATV